MRAQFYLIPAALVAAAPVQARVFMDIAAAQRTMFPHAKFRELAIPASAEALSLGMITRTWKVSTGGWFIVDQVEGKGDVVTYALALDDNGIVQRLEILECSADYDTVTLPRWRQQFVGKQEAYELSDVRTISGSTLSSRHITQGVQRILSTFRPPA